MFIFLGDVRQAIIKVRQYVESESAFFYLFLDGWLWFSSSLYLTLKSICIGSPVKKPSAKRRLLDIISDEVATSDDEPPQRRRHLSDTEDDDVLSTSQLSYGEVKEHRHLYLKRAKKEEIQTALVSNSILMCSPFLIFFFVICITFYFH